jgi:hypothetical protein
MQSSHLSLDIMRSEFSWFYYHIFRNVQMPNSHLSLDIMRSEFSWFSLSKTWHAGLFLYSAPLTTYNLSSNNNTLRINLKQ